MLSSNKCKFEETNEQEALSVLIRRCWRWINLLAGRKESKLTLAKQKGLIGELFFKRIIDKSIKYIC